MKGVDQWLETQVSLTHSEAVRRRSERSAILCSVFNFTLVFSMMCTVDLIVQE